MSAVNCPYCKTLLPPQETAEGWCDTCGKRIPLYILKADRMQPRGRNDSNDLPGASSAQERPPHRVEDPSPTLASTDTATPKQERVDQEVSRLKEALTDPRPHIRWDAAVQLGKLGSHAWPTLARLRHLASQDSDSLVRRTAQEALATVDVERTPADIPGLGSRPRDGSPASGQPPMSGTHRWGQPATRQLVGCSCTLCGRLIGSAGGRGPGCDRRSRRCGPCAW
jgi:hypothetical protein